MEQQDMLSQQAKPEAQARLTAILKKIQELTEEAQGLLVDIHGQKERKIKDTDENGEPTWRYALKVKMPKDIHLTKKMREYAEAHGIPEASLLQLWEVFVNWHLKNAKKWADWSRVWADWCRREKDRRASEAPKVRSSKSLAEF